MPSHDSDSQFRFLICCIKHVSSPGKVDFGAVATELGIVSKGAAAKRYERLMRAHGISSSSLRNPDKLSSGDSKHGVLNLGKGLMPGVGLSPAKKRKLEAQMEGRDDDEDIKPKIEDGVVVKAEEGVGGVGRVGIGRGLPAPMDAEPPFPLALPLSMPIPPLSTSPQPPPPQLQQPIAEFAPMGAGVDLGSTGGMMNGAIGVEVGTGSYYAPEYVIDGGEWYGGGHGHGHDLGDAHDIQGHLDHEIGDAGYEGAEVYWDGLTRFGGHGEAEIV